MERVVWCALLACALAASAVDEDREPPLTLPDVVVTAEPVASPASESLSRPLCDDPTRDLVEALLELPGVSGVSRGGDLFEPVIRGLGWERVITSLDGLPLYGACPSRMDPPVNYLHGEAASRVTVDLALPSLTLGPPGTAGRIRASTWIDREPTPRLELGGWLQGTMQTGREGTIGSFGLEGSAPQTVFRGTADFLNLDDYRSPDGTEVPAEQESMAASLTLQLHPASDHRWRHTVIYTREDRIEYPALPMDLDESEMFAYTTAYRWEPDLELMTATEIWFGLQRLDHLMSNTDRPGVTVMRATAPSTSDVLAGGARAELALGNDRALTLGFDTYRLEREAIRTRVQLPGGMTSRDRLWPDVTQTNVGVFAELAQPLAEAWRLRLGARLDTVRSQADDLDSPSLGGKTIRQQIATYYGSEAATRDDDTERLVSANLLVDWQVSEALIWYSGVGLAQRPATVTERFLAFAPYPGGYQLGNPGLGSERKIELVTGTEATWRRVEAGVAIYHAWVDDYILPSALTRVDVNGDTIPDQIRGYRNVDAALYGGEAKLTFRPHDAWRWMTTFAAVRGRNLTDDRDLPEIPPLEVRTALRADYGQAHPWWAELGVRWAASQNRVDPLFPEDSTAAFTVVHLKSGIALTPRLTLQAGIHNLFDESYHEHLTREAAAAVGELGAGDEIPAVGRMGYVSLRWTF